ncbi:MAG: hypothetical protein FD163_605 [Hyphomonadaceae bacterium]|nr:MAG: hypothetical protein FD128_2261 [Hyphomonadaceae bacterium]KAF0185937.1 MAG: hypothetical protein FD163_605 [Hyphomonadaceae bacterium]
MKKFLLLGFLAIGAIAATTDVKAASRTVQCWVTDVGAYPCTFTPLYRDGSFKISARGHDTYIVEMNGSGTAHVFLQIRGQGRNISLPGIYYRDRADRACWANYDPAFRICAR